MIELWGMQSPNVQKVVLLLEELGVAYRFHYVDVFMNENHQPDFLALTPNRKVPVLLDSEGPEGRPFKIWESGAILIYLAEKFGRFLPTVPTERYLALQWLMFQMGGIGPMFGQHSHFRVYARENLHQYSRDRYATEVKRLYDVLEGRFAKTRFLAGDDDYSIADMAAWPWVRGYVMRGVDPASIPNVVRWVDEIAAHPAAERTLGRLAEMKGYDLEDFETEHPDNLDRYLGRGKYSRP